MRKLDLGQPDGDDFQRTTGGPRLRPRTNEREQYGQPQMTAEFQHRIHEITVDNVPLGIAAISRKGHLAPIVFLHGFGSTKEDYGDIVRHPAFDGHPFLAYDAPGCGETHCADLSKISIPFLVKTALAMLNATGIEKFHIVGHSMGGLSALMLADAHPDRILSFTNIEGNIAPEDCFLSRQIVAHADPDPQAFLDAFIARTLQSPTYASALYSASLRHKIRAQAVRPIFISMVDLSDNGALIERFVNLPAPKMFIYGDQNATLGYLEHIHASGVRLCEIPQSGHFPMYSNPPVMWREISDFIGGI